MICPYCSKDIPDDSRFCVNCGKKLTETYSNSCRCTSCGSQIRADDKFCVNCGSPVSSTAVKSSDTDLAFQKAQLQIQAMSLKAQQEQLQLQQKQYASMPKCPRCGSTSLSGNKKGFGIGKAVVGAWAFGPLGLVAGNIGAKKVTVTCLSCGKQFKI
ncbi:Double zinc ribbon [Anaerocolumna jejuensis DSM 15929]|uniref:Double zinc ribbon n=1 Tax=Anaerocolumna jejuensis DSM 15929 TaxID=1121322 RepID=A0A1M6MLZ6_9FIRM|nr:zinc-ribbon domain-containing protein [Anaerocolumna jejuensis]SHJ84482.1 Double zinc ribbon [Anaerocolumna jejuensis DSM 15929]